MTHSNSQYRFVLTTLGILTILSLGAATMTFMALAEPSNEPRPLKTETFHRSITPKNREVSPTEPLIKAADLRQFSRQLHDISFNEIPQNLPERPIPYYLKEEGQNSIIYFYGEVDIRCWLALSNGNKLDKHCQLSK